MNLAPNIPERLKPFFEKQLGGFIKVIDKVKELKNAFNIPSDTDDSSVNLALGALLKKFSSRLPD